MSDLIERQKAIDAECEVCQIAPKKERGHNCTYYVHGCKEIECLRALPSAHSEIEERKAESEQNVPIEDLISRNAAIEAMSESLKRVFPEHRQIAEKCLKALPSAQPERKKGKWIPLFDGRPTCGVCWFYCSKCEKVVRNIEWNFCPNCGADMMEGQ